MLINETSWKYAGSNPVAGSNFNFNYYGQTNITNKKQGKTSADIARHLRKDRGVYLRAKTKPGGALGKKDELSRQYIKLHRLEADKKEMVKEFDTPIKETKKESKKTLDAIRTEMEEVTEKVYLIDDQQAGKMGYYNTLGHLVHERFLLPEEKQLRITTDTGTGN